MQYATRLVTSFSMPRGANAAERAYLIQMATSNAYSCGVSVAMLLARLCLYRLHSRFFDISLPPLAAPQRGLAEHFVFQALDYFASTRAVALPMAGEAELVHTVQQLLASTVMEPSFRAALEARWARADVGAKLRVRGTVVERAAVASIKNARNAAQRADVAEHGLLVCALPGCDKREGTIREFKVCSACRAVAYCSAEHGGLHWAGEHKHECKDLKAAGAKPARAVRSKVLNKTSDGIKLASSGVVMRRRRRPSARARAPPPPRWG